MHRSRYLSHIKGHFADIAIFCTGTVFVPRIYSFCLCHSRREDTGLPDVLADIEEVVEAAQGLKEVSQVIKDLSGFAHSTLTTTLSLSEAEVASLKEVFACLVCKGWYCFTMDQWEDGFRD